MKIEKFNSLESTNKYCESLNLAQVGDFTCYWALEQTSGIGQQGNRWHSAPRQNLTFSLVLHPTFLMAAHQFQLTQALTLALMDFLSMLGLRHLATIKWPNDIYIDGRKVCGTLVQTHLQGDTITTAICGIGLNVNQREFPSWIPHPTSLTLLTGTQYELEPLLHGLLLCVERRYSTLRDRHNMEKEYLSHLMHLGTRTQYIYKGIPLCATITGIDPYGHLLLTTDCGQQLRCAMKEIALADVSDYCA